MAKTIGQLTQATTLDPSDEFVIEQSGLTKRVAASVVRGGLVNADVDAAAAIAFSKLAALDSANILVGNGSNVATKVAVTGDVTVSNTGVTTLARPLTLATAQNTTSGTSIDFTGIPSWVKRITVMLNGVSTNGNDAKIIQLGTSGGLQTTAYNGASTFIGLNAGNTQAGHANFTSGIGVNFPNSANVMYGNVVITLQNGSDHTWTAHGVLSLSDAAYTGLVAGSKTLSAVLTQIRITTTGGTDTFDAGSVNIMYEG